MVTKVRKQIYVDQDQQLRLKRLARQTGLSEAALIREAIDRYVVSGLSQNRNWSVWEDELAFIDRLIEQGPVEGSRDWQREDLYD